MSESLAERARRKRAELGLGASPASAEPATWDDDLIPDPTTSTRRHDPSDDAIDVALNGLDILTAYRRWCGKMDPKVGKKRESVMVSCPNPAHPDKHPSAWLNLDKGVYTCAGCNFAGGDSYDIAAWHFGYNVPGYKTDGSFPELRRRMAADLGVTIHVTPTGQTLAAPPAPVAAAAPPAPAGDDDAEPPPADDSDESENDEDDRLLLTNAPSIDWESIVPKGTFLWQWMRTCTEDDLPEEYYFWLGLMAIGLAAGDDAKMLDRQPVKPNLFLTLLGPTGMGKSRSVSALKRLLTEAFPFKREDATGVLQVASPNSSETLIDAFNVEIKDPTTGAVTGYRKVRGFLSIDELSDLIGKAARSGNTTRETLMQLYDGQGEVTTSSRASGVVRATDPFCCTVTTTQPKALRRLLGRGDSASGFLNRWVFGAGPPKPLVAIGGTPLDIEPLVDPIRGLRAWASGGTSVELSFSGVQAFSRWFHDECEPMKLSGERELLGRIDLTLKKLILLFAINEKTTEPDHKLVERVLSLYPYLVETYNLIDEQLGVDEIEECCIAIQRYITRYTRKKGYGPSTTELTAAATTTYTRRTVLDALQTMRRLEQVEEKLCPAAAGRPSVTRYANV